ncbi:hypothetical protein N431DRAFT_461331 [Stipitochalara longipes BDJ]|nr:hypothetical protein N431DRAFT_461331 [Stipitochalara longipes BDJ]
MAGFSASLRRLKASARRKVQFRSETKAPDAAAPAPVPPAAIDPTPQSTSSSDTLQGQVEPKDSNELRSVTSTNEPSPSFHLSAELNNESPTPAKSSPESRIPNTDGQQDEEAHKDGASQKTPEEESTNENSMPLAASDTIKDKEARPQSTSNQSPAQIEAKDKNKIPRPTSDGQEVNKPVTPTLPVSNSSNVPNEPGPSKLPPPRPATAWTMSASAPLASSSTDVPALPVASTSADTLPVPSIEVNPPTPFVARNSATEFPLRWNPASPFAPSRESLSGEEERDRSRTWYPENHIQADGPSTAIFSTSVTTPTASASTSTHISAPSSSASVPAVPKSVGFAEASSSRHEIHHYHQSSPPASVRSLAASDRPPSTLGSKASSTHRIIKPHPKHMQGLADADPPNVYVVIKETAQTKDGGYWDQVLHKIQGIYWSERDANNKVVSMYNQFVMDITINISFYPKGYGSPFYRWETSKMVDESYIRVRVEKWSVKAESNEPEVAPRVRSMLDV